MQKEDPQKRVWQKPSEKVKQSLGIACCRKNNNKLEVLLVCKRYTYSYNLFVHAKYNSNNNVGLIELFNGMTVDEKLDILSLNFVQIWYRVWLNTPRNASYYMSKNKFETTFLPDNGARLKKLISKSVNSAKIWEIPKGRKRSKVESDLNCAIREFGEETNVHKKMYKLFPTAKRTYSFIDGGIRYINTYYIAHTKINIEPRINFGTQEQVDEICDIRWMSIEEIRMCDPTHRLEKFIRPIFNYVKKYIK
jgi:8-oxo-dGTP pyrophosphatase MutT (NUDIX family)